MMSESDWESDSDNNHLEQSSDEGSIVEPLPICQYRKFFCRYPNCTFSTTRHRLFADHIESTHECPTCGRFFRSVNSHSCQNDSQQRRQRGAGEIIDTSIFKFLTGAHRDVISTYEYAPTEEYTSLSDLFVDLDSSLVSFLSSALGEHVTLKVQFKLLVDLYDIKKKLLKPDIWLSTAYLPIRHVNFIRNNINYALTYLNNTLSIYNQNGSGYTLHKVNLFRIILAKYRPLSGAGYVPLPGFLKRKRGLLRIKNSDNYCFHYSIVAGIYKDEALKLHASRTKRLESRKLTVKEKKTVLQDPQIYLPFFGKCDFKNIRLPVAVEDIDTFENNNLNISLNCYAVHAEKEIIPIRVTREERKFHVDLLLYNNNNKSHFILISDLPAFLGKHTKHRHLMCKYCHRKFRKLHALNGHQTICVAKNQQGVRFPKEDYFEFRNLFETLKFHYVIYYDFETINRLMNHKTGFNTINTGKIEPSHYCLVLVGPNGLEHVELFDLYDGPDLVHNFLKSAESMANDVIWQLHNTNNRHPLTPEQMIEFEQTPNCPLCGCEFSVKNYKVKHHDHISGSNLHFCCARCNSRAKTQYMVPILSHGGANFDHHLVMKGLEANSLRKIKIIPHTSEKFVGFEINNKLRFMDSSRFLPGKLGKLAKALLADGEENFKMVFQYFRQVKEGQDFFKPEGYTDEEIRLVLGKQAFPYEIMTDTSCFDLTELPPIEKFTNRMTLKALKPAVYAHLQKVWNTFNICNFRQFTRLYNLTDTLILADLVQAHRKASYDAYNVEMLHKWGMPGFSFSVGMLKAKAKIEYIKDIEMLRMIRGAIRGGVTFCSSRLKTANNDRVGNFDASKPRSHIFYCDIRSLYPHVLKTYSMPVDSFAWLTREELDNMDVMSLPEDEIGTGYILEVDLEYPEHLHDSHDDMPLAPVKKVITLKHLSEEQRKILQVQKQCEELGSVSAEKLVLSLEHKENYVVYYKTLKFYIKQGLRMKGKVKRGIKFREAPIFREYMTETLEKRSSEKSEVMSQVYKCAACSFYGRCLQSTSKYVDAILCKSRAHALHLVSKAEFKDFYQISEDLSVFIMNRKNPKEDSLFFIGFVVLDLAKKTLYETHYDGIKTVFPLIRSIYSDTDSSYYYLESIDDETFISKLKQLSWLFDFSNLNPDHELYDTRNAGKSGVFKLEELDIKEFCGLSAKLYSYIKADGSNNKKAKGVSKGLVKHQLRHEDYVKTVKEMTTFCHVNMNIIKSIDQQLYYQKVTKVALSALDMKRYLLPNGLESLAYGNTRIKNVNNEQGINSMIVCENV